MALLGLCSVVPLVAWVYGLGAFAAWFWLLAVPAQVALAGIAWVAFRPGSPLAGLRPVFIAGVIGGLVGTAGYDLFRVPFVLLGRRLFAPIDSYGVLALGTDTSSALTGFVGWAYHFTNGIGFGIFYAAVALRRHWGFALVWAFVLETATVVTPFVDSYGLRGHPDVILIAYAAHVPYGLALGWAAGRPDRLAAQLREVSARTTLYALGLLLAGLVVWHRPFSTGSGDASRFSLGDGGRFIPTWVRIPVGGCVEVPIPAGGAEQRCFPERGVHRVRYDDRAYSGGFVIADEEMRR